MCTGKAAAQNNELANKVRRTFSVTAFTAGASLRPCRLDLTARAPAPAVTAPSTKVAASSASTAASTSGASSTSAMVIIMLLVSPIARYLANQNCFPGAPLYEL